MSGASTEHWAGRAVDDIADVQVDGEGLAIDGVNQFQICIRSGRQTPGHHFDGELGARWLDGVDQLAAVVDRSVEELFGEILGIWAVPDVWVVGAGNIDTAAGAHGFRQGEPFGDIVQVFRARLSIGV
jgi:hypothetical protein